MSDIDHLSEFMVYAHVRPLSGVVFEVLGPPTPPLPSRTRNGSMNSHISEFWKIQYFVHELVPRMADGIFWNGVFIYENSWPHYLQIDDY